MPKEMHTTCTPTPNRACLSGLRRRFGLKAQHAEVEFSDSNAKSAILAKGSPAVISHLLVR